MAQKQQLDLYEVLGVPRDAKVTDIGRAYNKYKAELAKDTTMPDHRRARRMEEAYATLSDPGKRSAYDATLTISTRKREGFRGVVFAIVIVIGFAAVVGGYMYTQREAPQAPRGAPSADEIVKNAAGAVGRLQAVDMSGRSTPIGLAFAVADRVMVSACHGITPGAQLIIAAATGPLPARVAAADDTLGVCKLSIERSSDRMLPLTTIEPRMGEKVYVAKLSPSGQVAFTEARIGRILDEGKAHLVEPTVRVNAKAAGAPVLDVFGRVVAIAAVAKGDGHVRHVVLPAAWISEINEPPKERKTQVSDEAPPPEKESAPAAPPVPGFDVAPERKEKLEKAFRPPPKVPSDL